MHHQDLPGLGQAEQHFGANAVYHQSLQHASLILPPQSASAPTYKSPRWSFPLNQTALPAMRWCVFLRCASGRYLCLSPSKNPAHFERGFRSKSNSNEILCVNRGAPKGIPITKICALNMQGEVSPRTPLRKPVWQNAEPSKQKTEISRLRRGTSRKPIMLLKSAGANLSRYAQRAPLRLTSHDPPRSVRLTCFSSYHEFVHSQTLSAGRLARKSFRLLSVPCCHTSRCARPSRLRSRIPDARSPLMLKTCFKGWCRLFLVLRP